MKSLMSLGGGISGHDVIAGSTGGAAIPLVQQNWTSLLSANNGFLDAASGGFDNNESTRASNNANGSGWLRLDATFSYGQKLEVSTGVLNLVYVNNVLIGQSTADPSYVVTEGSGTVTKIQIFSHNAVGYRADLYNIKSDDQSLITP